MIWTLLHRLDKLLQPLNSSNRGKDTWSEKDRKVLKDFLFFLKPLAVFDPVSLPLNDFFLNLYQQAIFKKKKKKSLKNTFYFTEENNNIFD